MQYTVHEHRMFDAEYIIEAETEDAARQLDGDILEESDSESWGYEVVSVEPLFNIDE